MDSLPKSVRVACEGMDSMSAVVTDVETGALLQNVSSIAIFMEPGKINRVAIKFAYPSVEVDGEPIYQADEEHLKAVAEQLGYMLVRVPDQGEQAQRV